MRVRRSDELAVKSTDDIVRARQTVRAWAVEMRFSLVDQTKLVTAASELARNMTVYGGGGKLRLEMLDNGNRQGLRMTFEDRGPGIRDIDLAMKDGYSTGEGMGLGLGGARRLMNEFELESQVGEGTSVVAIKWK